MKTSIDHIMTRSRLTVVCAATAIVIALGCPRVSAADQAGGYQLNAAELKLDCKKLTGRMKVRILQLRDYPTRPQASTASQIARPLLSPFLSGSGTSSSAGLGDRDAQDRTILHAYNKRLAALNCATFDVDRELQAKADGPVPQTQPKPKTSAAAPAKKK